MAGGQRQHGSWLAARHRRGDGPGWQLIEREQSTDQIGFGIQRGGIASGGGRDRVDFIGEVGQIGGDLSLQPGLGITR